MSLSWNLYPLFLCIPYTINFLFWYASNMHGICFEFLFLPFICLIFKAGLQSIRPMYLFFLQDISGIHTMLFLSLGVFVRLAWCYGAKIPTPTFPHPIAPTPHCGMNPMVSLVYYNLYFFAFGFLEWSNKKLVPCFLHCK